MRVDIVCRVIDNFGDIGVSWRLARQLAQEHGCRVRLWVDDVPRLHRLCENPKDEGVAVFQLHDAAAYDAASDVLIEAFGCGLPESWVERMATSVRRPLWIVLEYLSAEPWVTDCHGLPSPHPRHGLPRYFFFPGFAAGTGGLIRERDLLARRDAFDASAWRARMGLAPPAADVLTVSLFAYPHAPVHEWLAACARGPGRTRVLVAESELALTLRPVWGAGRDHVSLHYMPFVAQADYDEWLWACDINFVRGEDSFVRAQWAGKPLAWHIYPQASRAHEVKLDAFLQRHGVPHAQGDFWRAWNGVAGAPDIALAWACYVEALPALRTVAQAWPRAMAALGDLAGNLVEFVKKTI